MSQLDPTPIMQMLQGNNVAAVLRAGIRHRVFDHVAAGHTSARAIAETARIDGRGTAILLDALAALGMLEKRDESYANSPLADQFLRSDGATFVGGLADIFASPHLAAHLATLDRCVEAGGAVLETHAETPEHPFWNDFAAASGAMAGPGGALLAALVGEWLEAREGARVLDVACGSGLYGLQVLRECPSAHLTLQDWGTVLDQIEPRIVGMECDARTTRLPGNLFEVDLGTDHDLVVASHVFHHFDPAVCQSLMHKLAAATAPGGKIAIHDFIPGEGRPSEDPGPYLFSTMMLSWTRKGQAYTRADYTEWLDAAGFDAPDVYAGAGTPTRFLIATRRS